MINNPVVGLAGGALTGEQRYLGLNGKGQVTDVFDTPAKMICGAMSFYKDGKDILYTKDMFCLRPGESKAFDGNLLQVVLSFSSDGKTVTLGDNDMFVSMAEALYFAIR